MGRTRLSGSTGDRLLRVLETVVETHHPTSLAELSRSLDLPKATVHRLVNLLEENGPEAPGEPREADGEGSGEGSE